MEDSNSKKNIQSATQNTVNHYSKKYYIMFFAIMIVSFLIIFYFCNYTKLREMFQIIALTALSIAIAEYTTRRYFKL